MMKSFTKRIARLFLAYMCSFLLFTLLLFICIRVTLIRPAFMQQQIDDSHYVMNVHKEINEKIQDLGRGSNIPPEVVKDIVPEPFIEKNMNRYVDTLYNGTSFTLQDAEKLKQTMVEKLKHYAENKKIHTGEETNEGINQFVDSSLQVVKQGIEIPYLAGFIQRVSQYKATLDVFIAGAAVTFCVMVGMLALALRAKKESLFSASFILAGTGLSMVVFPLLTYFSGMIDRIGIVTRSLYEFVKTYLTAVDLFFVKTGIAVFALSVCILLVYGGLRYRREVAKVKKI